MDTKIIYEGWLIKQGGFIKTWKQRWFILRNDKNLYYYKTKEVK